MAIEVRIKASGIPLTCEDSEDLAKFPKTLFRSADTAIGPGVEPEAHRAVNRLCSSARPQRAAHPARLIRRRTPKLLATSRNRERVAAKNRPSKRPPASSNRACQFAALLRLLKTDNRQLTISQGVEKAQRNRDERLRSLAKIDCPIRGQECYNGLYAEPYSTGHQSEIHQP